MRIVALSAFAGLAGLVAAACGAPPARLVPPPPVNPATAIVGATTLGRHRPRARGQRGHRRARRPNRLRRRRRGVPRAQGARVIDAQGQYLIPGLIDSHVHLLFLVNGSAERGARASTSATCSRRAITTVRDMGTNPGGCCRACRAFDGRPAGLRHAARGRPPLLLQRLAMRRGAHRARRGVPPAAGDDDAVTWGGRRSCSTGTTIPIRWSRGARGAGAMGLKLYAQLDSVIGASASPSPRTAPGMPVWGHAWVQPASVREQATARAWTAWCTPPDWPVSCTPPTSATPS